MLQIQQRASGLGESTAGATYLTPKSCCISPLKVAVTLLSDSGKAQLKHSSHIVNVGVVAIC